jgi:hypothetical protein
MAGLPESPRARRRLLWTSTAGALLAVGLAIAFAIPNKGAPNAEPTGPPRPAQLAVKTNLKLTRADRHAIDALLDRFFPAAVERRDPDAAWALAGPEMRAASSLAQFRKGPSPVPSYPANEKNYHHWQAIDVERGSAILNILVHPRNPQRLGSWVFSTQVVKVQGRWLVNRIYTIAVMNPPTRPATVTHEVGPADYAAPPPSSRNHSTSGPGSHSLLLPIVAILALVLLIPISLGGVAILRALRWRRTIRKGGRTDLPPLPATYLQRADDQQELASKP